MSRRRRNNLRGAAGAAALALAAHAAIGAGIELFRPIPRPRLELAVDGDGKGRLLSQSAVDGISYELENLPGAQACGPGCYELAPGTTVTLRAMRGPKSTFEGFGGPCGRQAHRWFGWAQRVLAIGKDETEIAEHMDVFGFLAEVVEPPGVDDPLECRVVVDGDARVSATFGVEPDEVEVDWIVMPDVPEDKEKPERVASGLEVVLPDAAAEADAPIPPPPEPIPDQMQVKPEEVPPPPELAQVEPPKPVIPTPPQPAPPPQEKPKKEVQAPKLKSVEVPDENEVADAPDDASFLSDKNRDVAEETHAKETNLEKQQKGEQVASEKSDVKSEDVGAEDDVIRQMEDTEASDIDVERTEETAHSGKEKKAEGVRRGEEGESGDEGEAGDGRESKSPGVMAMRGIEGKGTPGSGPVEVAKITEEGKGVEGKPGDGGREGRRGKNGRRGIKTQLEFEDYSRIVGDDLAEEETKIAHRQMSAKRGRWEKKLGAIKSSLENFTPEVKPGNQTALKTRAAPFAVYIARMHRRIHELWGFGFLEDLDGKSSTSEMNDWTLFTTIEIVINPDGSVDKTTIVKPSGVLTFDVAAIDTVLTAGPYEEPPEKIRSPDGKTYMHWSFHRDWRQCGTFGAQPFILDAPRGGGNRDKGLDDSEIMKRVPKVGGKHDGHDHGAAGKREVAMPKGQAAPQDAAAATARATASMPAPDDPRASHAANMWLTGFTKNDIDKMMKVTGVPFRSGDNAVASTASEVQGMYRNILGETGNRIPTKTRLLSAAGYRKLFGALPAGVEGNGSELFFVVRLKREQFTLILVQRDGGEYQVAGFYR